MSEPGPGDTPNPPYNSLSRTSRSSHVIVGDISIPLYGTPLQTGHISPVSYLFVQCALTETDDVTHDTPVLRIFPFTFEPHLLQHISVDISELRPSVLTTVFLL